MSNDWGPIRDALAEVLAPLVAADGGKLYWSRVSDREVLLHWAGRYAGSPAASLLHDEVAVPLIRRMAPDLVINWSSGQLIPPNAELVEPRSSESK